MAKPILYLFVGYPGAGKTTVARLIKKMTGATHIWADHERSKMFKIPDHSRSESEKLYRYLDERTDQLLHEGKSVLFDTNFNFYHDREYLRQIATKNGADSVLIWLTTPKELARKRAVEQSHDNGNRVYGNMTDADFERICSHLEPPQESEHPVMIDGSNVTEQAVKQRLAINTT
jgi:hypothetical protein